MITICRRKIVPLGTCLFSLSALHVHKYDCLIPLIFGVLFSWFNRCFCVQLYCTYLIEMSGENKIPTSRPTVSAWSNYLRFKNLLPPPNAGIAVRINLAASAQPATPYKMALHLEVSIDCSLWNKLTALDTDSSQHRIAVGI